MCGLTLSYARCFSSDPINAGPGRTELYSTGTICATPRGSCEPTGGDPSPARPFSRRMARGGSSRGRQERRPCHPRPGSMQPTESTAASPPVGVEQSIREELIVLHQWPDQVGLDFQIGDKPLCEISDAMGPIIDRNPPASKRSNSPEGGGRDLSSSLKRSARHRRAVIEGARQCRHQGGQYHVILGAFVRHGLHPLA
jgi:hypothetical protein